MTDEQVFLVLVVLQFVFGVLLVAAARLVSRYYHRWRLAQTDLASARRAREEAHEVLRKCDGERIESIEKTKELLRENAELRRDCILLATELRDVTMTDEYVEKLLDKYQAEEPV